jgi:DNA-binding PadR family transcriptional regulator
MRILKGLSTTEVSILSLINEEETHGYHLNEKINHRGYRNWTDIAFSSIYAILNRLEKKKLIKSRLDPSHQGPPRKLYRISNTGKTQLLSTFGIYLTEPTHPRNRIDIAVGYIDLLPKPDVIQYLQTYREKIQHQLESLQETRQQQRPIPIGAEFIFDHALIQAKAELEWIDSILKKFQTTKKKVTPNGKNRL